MKLRRDKQHAFDPGITIRASQISQLTVGLDEALIADASEVNYLKLKTVIEDFLEAETGVPCELSWRHGDQFRIEPADIVADRR